MMINDCFIVHTLANVISINQNFVHVWRNENIYRDENIFHDIWVIARSTLLV